MKILSNFNTTLEKDLLREYQQVFGKDKVMSIHKSKLFYRRYVWGPVVIYIMLLIVSVGITFGYEMPHPLIPRIVLGIFALYAVILFFKVAHRWVDYKMDFLIVTPKEITKYDQSGVLERHIEQLHADKIKSISLSKKWFLQSIFDIGTISLLAEWDNDKGDIVMDYVDAVEAEKRKISHVLGLDE